MGVHRALGLAGGARGVDQDGQVVGPAGPGTLHHRAGVQRVVLAAQRAQGVQADHARIVAACAGPPCRRPRSCAAAAAARALRAPCRAARRLRRTGSWCASPRTGTAPGWRRRSGRCRWRRRRSSARPGRPAPSRPRCWPGSTRVSWGLKPRLSSPPAISRTASPVCCQVELRQMPRSFWRIQTFGPRCSTAFQNIADSVSPGTTMSVQGWMCAKSQRLLIPAYLQFFFFFQRRSPRTPVSFRPR